MSEKPMVEVPEDLFNALIIQLRQQNPIIGLHDSLQSIAASHQEKHYPKEDPITPPPDNGIVGQ